MPFYFHRNILVRRLSTDQATKRDPSRLLLSPLSLVGLGSLLGARGLGLVQRVGALVEDLKVLACGVGARGALGHIRFIVIELDLDLEVGRLLGDETTGSQVEKPDGSAKDSGVGEGGLGNLIGLYDISTLVTYK